MNRWITAYLYRPANAGATKNNHLFSPKNMQKMNLKTRTTNSGLKNLFLSQLFDKPSTIQKVTLRYYHKVKPRQEGHDGPGSLT